MPALERLLVEIVIVFICMLCGVRIQIIYQITSSECWIPGSS